MDRFTGNDDRPAFVRAFRFVDVLHFFQRGVIVEDGLCARRVLFVARFCLVCLIRHLVRGRPTFVFLARPCFFVRRRRANGRRTKAFFVMFCVVQARTIGAVRPSRGGFSEERFFGKARIRPAVLRAVFIVVGAAVGGVTPYFWVCYQCSVDCSAYYDRPCVFVAVFCCSEGSETKRSLLRSWCGRFVHFKVVGVRPLAYAGPCRSATVLVRLACVLVEGVFLAEFDAFRVGRFFDFGVRFQGSLDNAGPRETLFSRAREKGVVKCRANQDYVVDNRRAHLKVRALRSPARYACPCGPLLVFDRDRCVVVDREVLPFQCIFFVVGGAAIVVAGRTSPGDAGPGFPVANFRGTGGDVDDRFVHAFL